jgi:Flp pilus assembly protein TadG
VTTAVQGHLARKHYLGGSECGAVLVEMAVSLTLLLTMLFGLMEISLLLFTYHFISEAAREATRYAIVRGSSCSGWASACPASSTDVTNYIRGLGYPGIDPTAITVTTTWPTTGTSCTPSVTPCNNPGNLVKVKLQYAFPLTLPFTSFKTVTMTSTSQMVISQ